MSDNNFKSNLNSKITIVAIVLLLLSLIFFFVTKNASDQVSKVLKSFEFVNQSSVIPTVKKINPESIDKADILLKKTGEVTWNDILEVSPDDQKILYSSFTQEQKDKLVKTWNDLKTTTGGDPSKARE